MPGLVHLWVEHLKRRYGVLRRDALRIAQTRIQYGHETPRGYRLQYEDFYCTCGDLLAMRLGSKTCGKAKCRGKLGRQERKMHTETTMTKKPDYSSYPDYSRYRSKYESQGMRKPERDPRQMFMRTMYVDALNDCRYPEALRSGRGVAVLREAGIVEPGATKAEGEAVLAELVRLGVLHLALSTEPGGTTGYELVQPWEAAA